MTTPMLEVEGLCAGYGGASVLVNVSLRVDRGETVAVVGGNGAGKTTLIRTIAGMVSATAGCVRYDGGNITNLSSDRICERGIAQSPEGRQLFQSLSVEDNLRLGAILKRARARTMQHFARFRVIFQARGTPPPSRGHAAGGEQQMLAIGRALMADPDLTIADGRRWDLLRHG